MKIKRFLAKDMRSALQQVRAEHGPDAVILSNRMTDDGIEIVAASHYEQEHVLEVLTESSAAGTEPSAGFVAGSLPGLAVSEPAASAATPPHPLLEEAAPPDMLSAPPLQFHLSAPAPAPVAHTAPHPFAPVESRPAMYVEPHPVAPVEPHPAVGASDSGASELPQLRAEIMQMRQLFERQMQRMGSVQPQAVPGCPEVVEWMDAHGFDAALSADIAGQIPSGLDAAERRERMFGLIAGAVPVCPADPLDEGGIIALVGPAGAGKTTVAAKLAARYSTRHSARDVALVSTDTRRIGGSDLVCHYGHRLGVAVQDIDTGTDLNAAMQRVADYPLVLMDTAGLAQRDRALTGQLNWLRGAHTVRVMLVLAANTHPADIAEAIRRFGPLNPHGVILTRLDETARPGSALSILIEHQLPLAWVSDGQRLHDDLHPANAESLLLRMDARSDGAVDADTAPGIDLQHLAA